MITKADLKTLTQHKLYLYVEFFLLCLFLPGIIIAFRLAPMMFLFLWSAAAYCATIYRQQFFSSFSKLWNWSAVNFKTLKPMIIRWIICSILMYAFTLFYDPDRVFALVKRSPEFTLVLLCMYPILSALPQEFIFCSFFFKRYEAFFGNPDKNPRNMIIASAIVFAYAHVLFINPIAPTLSLIAGLIFASTFANSKSLALVTIEHGLYGNSLFVIGLGWYFFGGAVAMN